MAATQHQRIEYIDRLRGLAVVGMFFVHPATAWLSAETKTTEYFRNFMQVSGMIAPTFMFLAGLSIAIIADRADRSGKDMQVVKRHISKRGLEILLLGYGLHIVMYLLSGAGGPFVRALKVDILHCIGLTMAIVPWIAFPKGRFNFTALILAVLLPPLSMLLYRLPIGETLPSWIAGYFTSKTKYTLFPFIPYSTWILFGLFFGPLFLRGTESTRRVEQIFWMRVVLSAVIMWFLASRFKSLYYAAHLDTWRADKPQVVGVPHFFWTKGAVILVLLTFFRVTAPLFDRVKQSFFVEFGRRSLFAYCVHLLIIYPLAGSYFYNRLGIFGHLLASTALTALMFLLVLFWNRLRKANLKGAIQSLRPSP